MSEAEKVAEAIAEQSVALARLAKGSVFQVTLNLPGQPPQVLEGVSSEGFEFSYEPPSAFRPFAFLTDHPIDPKCRVGK